MTIFKYKIVHYVYDSLNIVHIYKSQLCTCIHVYVYIYTQYSNSTSSTHYFVMHAL
jgi:hypothetical protein